jgi:2-methylcitrate dehydratase PrpD
MADTLLAVLAQTIARPIGEAERKRARLHLLDWLACVAGARDTEAGHLGGLISRQGWERATYAGNALGLEDVHRAANLNPGPVIWPAAMSMGSASMDARLDASVRGYEAMIAIGAALDAHHHTHWYASATAGVFGAAAAFGSLIGFAEVEYRNGLGNAGSVAGGLRYSGDKAEDNTLLTRQWQIYHAVRTGRDAAMHVHFGATGPEGILEGEHGVFAAMTENASALASSHEGWRMAEVQFKGTSEADILADPGGPDSEAEITCKMRTLGKRGGLSDADIESAADLALYGDDVAAIDTMLENWLA